MRGIVVIAFAMLASPAFAASPDATRPPDRFTPEIHGLLTDHGRPLQSNVCLRQGGSEIRSCSWTDFSGHFYIPASDKFHPARKKKSDADDGSLYPSYWLEVGNVQHPKRIGTVDLVDDNRTAIELDCDLARDAGAGGVCETRPAQTTNAGRVSQSAPRRPGRSGR